MSYVLLAVVVVWIFAYAMRRVNDLITSEREMAEDLRLAREAGYLEPLPDPESEEPESWFDDFFENDGETTTLRPRDTYPQRAKRSRWLGRAHRPEPVHVSRRGDTEFEPAYQFPGVPDGWTLDRYAADGLVRLQIMLAQDARRRSAWTREGEPEA